MTYYEEHKEEMKEKAKIVTLNMKRGRGRPRKMPMDEALERLEELKKFKPKKEIIETEDEEDG